MTFPEAPRWRDGRLWFSDFYSHRVLTVDLDGRTETVAEVRQQPSGLGWTPEGKLLIVSMRDRRLLQFDGAGIRLVADPRGNRVVRVFEGGRIDQTISTGSRGAYACMLRGDDRRTLLIGANTGSSPMMARKKDGQVGVIRVDVPGAVLP